MCGRYRRRHWASRPRTALAEGRIQPAAADPFQTAKRTGAMAYETILYDAERRVATITLNRPERLNTIVPPMPDEVEAAVHRAVARPGGEGDRPARRRARVLRRLRLRRRLSPLGRALTTDGAWDPGKDFVVRHGAHARADPEVHERVALAEAGDRAGARLVRRRRQRLRAVRRPRDRQRGRADRHARTRACGARTCRACGSTAWASRKAKEYALTGQAALRRRGGRGRPDQRGRPVRRPRGEVREHGRASSPRSPPPSSRR